MAGGTVTARGLGCGLRPAVDGKHNSYGLCSCRCNLSVSRRNSK